MIINSEHILKFECEDESILLPPLTNPIYIYKEGDKFTYTDLTQDEPKPQTFEVLDVKRNIEEYLIGEQIITAFVKEIKE